MNFDSYQDIRFERRDRILEIIIDRPASLNAVNVRLHEELSRVFYDAALDEGSDVLVITGAGRAFCAGGDIAWMQDAIDRPRAFERTVVEGKKIVFGLLDCEKPIIAKVNGDAVGLGATIALLCDVIFASRTARIGDPHVRVGLVAGDGGAIIWPQLIGYARAKEYLMSGKLLTGEQAAQIGLINHAVEPDALDSSVAEFASSLADGATQSIRWTKTVMNLPLKQLAHSLMDASLAYEMVTNVSAEHREGVAAFRERRAPRFTGHKA
jgi:enoyl-CoA hydratase